MSRIGLLGGTFDPPHRGHLIVAADVRRELDLDEVWLIPAAIPPHKPDRVIAAGEVRLEMVRALVSDGAPGRRPPASDGSDDEGTPPVDGDSSLRVSDIEMRRGGVSYTVDTLRALTAAHPDDEFYLVMGVDQFATLASWRDAEEIGRIAQVIVMGREGVAAPAIAPGTRVRGTPVEVTRVDVSSTEIRDRIARGEDVVALVGRGVAGVIERNGLYRGA